MPTDRRSLILAWRHGLGTGLTFILAMILAWPLSFLSAIFAAMFLQSPVPISGRSAITILSCGAGAMAASWLGMQIVLAYPLLFFITLFVALFMTFRFAASGGSPLLVIFLLIALLLLPNLLLASPELAAKAALWIVINLAFGLLVSAIMFTLLPAATRLSLPPASDPVGDFDTKALKMTLITAPFAIAFFSFGWTSVLTLIFIALLSQQLSAASGAAVARGMLIANIIGGFVAVIAYEMIVIAPNVLFMAVLSLALILYFSDVIASDEPWAPLAGSAMTTFLILLGGSMAPFGDDADAKFGDRIIQVAAAAAYVIAAFTVIDAFVPESQSDAYEREARAQDLTGA